MQMKPSPLERLAPTAALLLLTGTAAAQAPWTQLSPASGPSAREGAATANDGSTMYLSGGKQGTNVGGYDELWSFDGTDWTLETPAGGGFPARGTHATAWDAARSVLVLFGGTTNSPVWPTRLNDTWEWTPAGGWVPASPLTSPDPVGFIDMVYVPGLGCVVHGGAAMDASGVAYTSGDTWAYDGTTWTKIATGPVVTNGKLVHRAAQNDLIYFGGADSAGVKVADTWSFDLATLTWTQVVTATLPFSSNATTAGTPGLVGMAMYVDGATGRVVAHGGQGVGGPPSDLTWEFDGTDWSDATPSPAGPMIRNVDTEWIPGAGRAYFCTGHSGTFGYKDETWERGGAGMPGSFTVLGTGCPGSTGLVPGLSSSGPPTIGQPFEIELTNPTPVALPLLVLGGSDQVSSFGPLPLPLALLFAASPMGCELQVSNDLFLPMGATPMGTTVTLPIPVDFGLVGVTVFLQGLQAELDASFNLALYGSSYAAATIGS